MRNALAIIGTAILLALTVAPAIAGKILPGGHEAMVPVAVDGGVAPVTIVGPVVTTSRDGGMPEAVMHATAPDGTIRPANSTAMGDLIAGTVPALCSQSAQAVTAVGTAAATVPASPMSGRRYIRVCNSVENAGSPKLKCLLGGTAPVMGATTAGDALAVGDCVQYPEASTVLLKCISDAAGTAAATYECR